MEVAKQIYKKSGVSILLAHKTGDINSFGKVISQQTQNICITFMQCWTNVEDVGPTLHKCYPNVLCLLGLNVPKTVGLNKSDMMVLHDHNTSVNARCCLNVGPTFS